MAAFQIAWNSTTHVATIQTKGDALPSGSSKIAEFTRVGENDPENAGDTQTPWHYVRDALYKQGWEDMQRVRIDMDSDYVALTGITIAPATVTINVNGTSQLTITKAPANASNGAVTWVSSDPTKATVSATGLVTGKATGSATVTATSVDGAKVATRTITVNAG